MPRDPRHPAEVISDRLAGALETWYDSSDPDVRHAVSVLRYWLDTIAENARKASRERDAARRERAEAAR